MLELRPVSFDHPDAVRLIAEVQAFYRLRYGDEDATPVDPAQFAAPLGFFTVGYVDGTPVACGGWRARDAGEDPSLADGDAEVKRMYVDDAHRGRGYARSVLAELERTAVAAGRRRAVLETGTKQPEAIALYVSCGYTPIAPFGAYRCEPNSRCYAKEIGAGAARRPGARAADGVPLG
ncbi:MULTISPECIES: GNAT family N-acetyltransferase [unclassified Pseudonocardia]|uniref:GNAT family N-acetyltransferase n=1 Tax=unclassified Pseudonocardia TaxID=2619320 RepID=UPI000969BE5F|nr:MULTISPECIES: GNAT family N-acetyltransferase [unclassified Pseudonocardia]MBN9101408.1 GNAT family N-acetyltransferase [Pseudonocardia sp.]OJY42431.1 MAG: GNAT family N-acetyltransferase [Pseudonocardia sp. 73-21]